MNSKLENELKSVLRGSNFETITQSIYDTVPYPTSGYADMFVLPLGYTGKTDADTNMFISSQIPSGQAFIVDSISIKLLTDHRASEKMFYRRGAYSFVIGAKNYLTMAPIGDTRGDFEAPELNITFDTAGEKVTVSATASPAPRPFELTPNNLLLAPNQNFRLQLCATCRP